jgi:hypothetical protein
VKILSILCLAFVLNGCFGLGAITYEPVENETEFFSISYEKNEFDDDGNPARLTKDILISTWGEPDEISEEGKCEVVTYYDGHAWSGAYVQLTFVPLPLVAPTEHYDENRFYFVNGESVALVKKRGYPTNCLGVMGILPNAEIDCREVTRKADNIKARNGGKLSGIKVKWCDESIAMDWAEHRDSLAEYQLYYSGSSRTERLRGLCNSADSGYALAQAEVGRLYKGGLMGVKQDLTKAYFWYSMANKQNPNMWNGELNEVRQKAPSVQRLSSFEGVASEVQDGQCERDFVPKTTLN